MSFDATFWVAVSFVLFVGVLFYFKVPQKIFITLEESINKIKKDIEEAEKLKEDAKNILSEYESKLDKSKVEIDLMIKNAQKESEKNRFQARLNEVKQPEIELNKKLSSLTSDLSSARQENEKLSKIARKRPSSNAWKSNVTDG